MTDWTLRYDGFEPEQEGLREALCTLGNGYFASRGAACWAAADDVHYPGTYVAGCFNRLTTAIAGRSVENESLVNAPNWLPLDLRLPDGQWLDPRRRRVLDYRQELDLARGELRRHVRLADARDRRTAVTTRRLVHLDRYHLAALELTVTAENWSGPITVWTALDGTVTNSGVARYRDLAGDHLRPAETGAFGADGIALRVTTSQSRVDIAEAARTLLHRRGGPVEPQRHTREAAAHVAQEMTVELAEGEALTVDKRVAVYTARDPAISEAALEARDSVTNAPDYAHLARTQAAAWAHLWRRFDIEIDSDDRSPGVAPATALRVHLFHLLQTASPNTIDLDVGVPARGLHGEAYRGHIFWDELFIFPTLNLRVAEITRGLLKYRFRRLGRAREAAAAAGLRGALFPWQSASNGREETQALHLNPRSGRWLPDHSHLQRHINAAIAYNVWQYYQVTADLELMAFYGAEMLLEIARCLASLCTWNGERGRYEIRGVVGPDEYHDGYPGSERPGIDNNAYTNVMTVWVLRRALEILERLPEDRRALLCDRLALDDTERETWRRISRAMFVPFHDGVISQFEGYERLAELDWEGYRRRYGNIQRLDRILEAEGDSPDRYRCSKQADALMLFYLFSADELRELFGELGYGLDREAIPRTIDYYMARTSHGSTLSYVAHSAVLARAERAGSWALCRDALRSDIADIQGGTTAEGIHLGAMAGSAHLIQGVYTGLEVRDDVLWLNPCLPEHLQRLVMRIHYRGQSLELTITGERGELRAVHSRAPPVRVGLAGEAHELSGGQRLAVACAAGRRPS